VDEKVNLEPAMKGHNRFGGHFVQVCTAFSRGHDTFVTLNQGHVDCVVTIKKIEPEGNSIWYTLELSPEESFNMRYLIPKGYVALDGTSLTVCGVDDESRTFTIMMIAHTQAAVIMPKKSIGDKVNVEFDMLGKYVERMINVKGSQVVETYAAKMLKEI
jgi:riboflavin synthase